MENLSPLPSIYSEDFIAANQSHRADNVSTRAHQLETIRGNIRDFKARNQFDKVIVLWTATMERCVEVKAGINATAEEVLRSIQVR